MNFQSFPKVPLDLLEALEVRYENKLPSNRDVALTQVNYLQGQQAVVQFLRLAYEKQNENILEDT